MDRENSSKAWLHDRQTYSYTGIDQIILRGYTPGYRLEV